LLQVTWRLENISVTYQHHHSIQSMAVDDPSEPLDSLLRVHRLGFVFMSAVRKGHIGEDCSTNLSSKLYELYGSFGGGSPCADLFEIPGENPDTTHTGTSARTTLPTQVALQTTASLDIAYLEQEDSEAGTLQPQAHAIKVDNRL
jgi:hypothetical protein